MLVWELIKVSIKSLVYTAAIWLLLCLIAEIFAWEIFYIKRKIKYRKVEGKIIEKQKRRFIHNIKSLPYNYYLKITKNRCKDSFTRDLLVSKEDYLKFKVGDYIKKKNFKLIKIN